MTCRTCGIDAPWWAYWYRHTLPVMLGRLLFGKDYCEIIGKARG